MTDELIEKLQAEREIRDQLHRYCDAVNGLDIDALATVWHADATIDCEEPVLKGPAVEAFGPLLQWYRLGNSRNIQFTNVIIEVEGDRAVSESYSMDVLGAMGSESVADRHRRGRYLDRWSRRGGLWALDHRAYVLSYEWGQNVLVGDSSKGGEDR